MPFIIVHFRDYIITWELVVSGYNLLWHRN